MPEDHVAGRGATPRPACENRHHSSTGLVESEAVGGPNDALRLKAYASSRADWPALLDAIEPLLAEMREEQERSP